MDWRIMRRFIRPRFCRVSDDLGFLGFPSRRYLSQACRDCLGICSEPTSSVAVIIEDVVIFGDSEKWVAEEGKSASYFFMKAVIATHGDGVREEKSLKLRSPASGC